MTAEMTVRDLNVADETVVKAWLRPYLEQHLAWWTVAYGTLPRYDLTDLVNREWHELVAASRTPEQLVCVAEATAPLGIVYASLREDRYMGISLGVLSWLYVAEEA